MNRIDLIDIFDEPYCENGNTISSYDGATSLFHQEGNRSYIGSIFDKILKNNKYFKEIFDKNTYNTSVHLTDYKNKYTSYSKNHMTSNFREVDDAIGKHGSFLSKNQILFHAGTLKDHNGNPLQQGSSMQLYRPLSTSFSPEPAYNNAFHKGKAYDNGEVSLIKITVKSKNIKAYIYGDGSHNNEYEVLLKSGPSIFIDKINIITHVKAEKMTNPTIRPLERSVPYKFIEASIY